MARAHDKEPARRWWHPRWTDFLGLLGAAGFAVQVYRGHGDLYLMGGSLVLATYSTTAPRLRDAIIQHLDPRKHGVGE